jgi:tetratricopeptide (TPR) repeat protein
MGANADPSGDADRIAELPLPAEERARLLARLGAERLQRYRDLDSTGTASRADVEAAVVFFRAAVGVVPRGAADGPAYCYNLALALQSRYDVLHNPADLDEAVTTLRRGSTAAREGAYVAVLQYALGSALRRAHELSHDPAVLGEAIGLLGDALASQHSETLDLADCLYEYGRAVLTWAEAVGERKVVDEAVEAFAYLVESVDPSAPAYSAYLDGLGSARLLRFDRYGLTDDLQAAVLHAGQAVQAQRERDQVTAAALSNLAGALWRQGSRQASGNQDLDRAIDLMGEALSLPGTASLRPGLASNLSAMLLERSERSGSIDDLEKSVRLAETAARATPDDAPEQAERAHLLAVARRARYLRLDDRDDLTAAVAAHERALQACPVGHPDRPALLSSWANTLRTRYDAAGELNDLRAAVKAYDETLSTLHNSSPDRALHLNNLGAVLTELAAVTDDAAASSRASKVLAEAVALAAPASLERLRALINLGNVLADQYERTQDPMLRERALRTYAEVRDASGPAAAGPETLLQAALNCGEWAEERGDWAEAVEWLEYGLDAVDDLLIIQHTRRYKESWLRDARGVAARTAIAALRNHDATRAVTAAERGRALLVAEAIEQARLDLDRLDAIGEHELRLRFEAARAAAGAPDQVTGRPRQAGESGPDRARLVDLRALRDEIRQVPGLEGFLAPLPLADISTRARGTQLLYLLATSTTGAALLVTTGHTRGWELPKLTDTRLRAVVEDYLTAYERRGSNASAWLHGLEQATRWLWGAVIEPLLPHLDTATPVTVVAGGLLGLLPLHAAWIEDATTPTGRLHAADVLCLRFAPSARALTPHPWLGHAPGTVRLLSGPGMVDPPLELDAVRAVVQVVGGDLPTASVDDAVAALQARGVVHLNCHGIGRLDRPLDSAVLLADGSLTLEHVLRERLHADLVVLSACETASLGTQLPDEVVGLPAGFLQAGVDACIGSLWAVPTAATAALMSLFYQLWTQKPVTAAKANSVTAAEAQTQRPIPAAEALRQAQRQLRDATNDELTQLVPTVVSPPAGLGTLGRQVWAGARPFRTMTSWAGFLYVGV